MAFFTSAVGQFLVQSVMHSVVIAILVEVLIKVWRIRHPLLQIRFRLLPLLLPLVYLPLFDVFYPARTSSQFHQQAALFDSNQWLALRLFDGLQAWHLFVLLLVLTLVYVLGREALPALKHYLWQKKIQLSLVSLGQFPKLDMALSNLVQGNVGPPLQVFLAEEGVPVIYSTGRNKIVLSAVTIELLDADELEMVLAHEMAHSSVKARTVYLVSLWLRALTFYNPVAILVFHHILSDSEKLCDDIAIAAVGKRLSLGSGLLKVFRYGVREDVPKVVANGQERWWSQIGMVQDRASSEAVKERMARILHEEKPPEATYPGFRLSFGVGMLVLLLFFVV